MSMNKQSCCYCCIVGEDEFMATLILTITAARWEIDDQEVKLLGSSHICKIDAE